MVKDEREGASGGSGKITASERVYRGIMQDLEDGRMVPGQRLIETELAQRFAVGRNAVREAIQRLSVRGVVDSTRFRSPAIRQIDAGETDEILDVAEALTVLAARAAALAFARERDHAALVSAVSALTQLDAHSPLGAFSRARRRFYRTILAIGRNRELQRLFPAVGMHIVYSQFQLPALRQLRIADYQAVCDAIIARDPDRAARAAQDHIAHVRATIAQANDTDHPTARRTASPVPSH